MFHGAPSNGQVPNTESAKISKIFATRPFTYQEYWNTTKRGIPTDAVSLATLLRPDQRTKNNPKRGQPAAPTVRCNINRLECCEMKHRSALWPFSGFQWSPQRVVSSLHWELRNWDETGDFLHESGLKEASFCQAIVPEDRNPLNSYSPRFFCLKPWNWRPSSSGVWTETCLQ